MRGLDLPPNPEPFPASGPKRILALSGGGYCGLFSAEVLANLDSWASPAPICERFDLFAGTSIGGLLAIGLALDIPPAVLRDTLVEHGPKIFARKLRVGPFTLPWPGLPGPAGGVLRSKYDPQALVDVLSLTIGPERMAMKVAEVPKPFLVVTTCVTSRAPFLVSNLKPVTPTLSGMTVEQAMLATAAAPGYFPAVQFGARTLVDGGLVANAPELAAIAELVARRLANPMNVRVLSIGAAAKAPRRLETNAAARGLLRWLTGQLMPLTIFAQERMTVEIAQALLGDRYLRIEATPRGNEPRVVDLDRTDAQSRAALRLMADRAVRQLTKDSVLSWLGQPG